MAILRPLPEELVHRISGSSIPLANEVTMPRILVSNGNIGSHVAEILANRGESVRMMVRGIESNRRWDELGIEQFAVDLDNRDSLTPAFANVDRFFCVTPFVANLAELGRNAVAAAKQAGVRHIVRSSIIGASPTGIAVARWHWEVEREVEASGIPFTILQPNTFMQSCLGNASSIAADNAFYLPQGDSRVSMVDTRDIAAVAATCLVEPGHAGKRYVVTGTEALSNFDVADRLSALLGRKITYVDVTPEQMEQSLAGAGVPAWMSEALLELFAICKQGFAADVSPTVARICQRPPLSFERFLRDHAAAFNQSL